MDKVPALRIAEASIGYSEGKKNVAVAGNVSASLCCGELVALIGRNGAGKSTLLRTLASYQRPIAGRVEYGGKDVKGLTALDIAKSISVVFTGTSSIASMSVQELVELGRTPYTGMLGILSDADRLVVKRSMQAMGIESFASKNLTALSDGERQKCLIAKALAQETPVILLDEPTAFLDYPSKVHLLKMLKRLTREEKKAVIVSTHDLELALRIADRVWFMSAGTLNTGTVAELEKTGALEQLMGDTI